MVNAETLIDSIGHLNDDILIEYGNLIQQNHNKKNNYIKWIAIAACLCALISAGLYVISNSAKQEPLNLAQKNRWHPNNTIDFIPEPKETDMPTITTAPTENTTPEPQQTITPAATAKPTEAPIFESTTEPKEQETDWESEWTYFIAHLHSEQGKGVTAHPDDKVLLGHKTASAENYSDEYFINNSLWTFEFEYNGGLYKAHKSGITKENIGAYLCNINLNIYERRLKFLHYNKSVAVFAINKVSPEAALAVCVNSDEYYLFVNSNYSPNNLNEFLSDFDLSTTAKLTQMAIFNNADNSIEAIHTISDETNIWNALLSSAGTITDSLESESIPSICIEMNNDFYSYYNVTFSLYDEGYIYFNVLGYKFSFNIEKDILNKIIPVEEITNE